ncbi:MAG: sialidase family protein [bacterium]|nr:sialidase family protein [bacterium]
MDVTIYKNKETYSAFPDITKLEDGDLLVVFREGKQHIGPGSEIVLIRSKDKGESWSERQVIYSHPFLDARDPSITQIQDGRLIVNFFILDLIAKKAETWIIRSSDNGYTWEEPIRVEIPFRGGATSSRVIELPDRCLLLPMYGKYGNGAISFVAKSMNGGDTWGDVSIIARRIRGRVEYYEPSLLYLSRGNIIAMIRSSITGGYLYQSESLDYGNTWSDPKKTDIWGHPADLLQLKDGRILCTYGYRKSPFGIRGVISEDQGRTWDVRNKRIIRRDGLGWDIGYPSSVEVDKGRILTVYYFYNEDGVRFIGGSFYFT